jgi:tetratricopeptide (TPR) repeat protein
MRTSRGGEFKMKKLLKIILILAIVGAAGYGIYVLSIPKSQKIRAEISRILDSSMDNQRKLWKIDMLESDLASAYVDEGKFDDAIKIYEFEIEKTRRDGKIEFWGYRHSTSYALEAAQFRQLAFVYELKKDHDSAAKAIKKAESAEATAARLEKTEPKAKKEKSLLD